jgi:tetratricopeptide (TPR) repeat protein
LGKWACFPHLGHYELDAAAVTRLWPRLHAGDAQPLPTEPAVLAAWVLYHQGRYQQAAEAGVAAGGQGITVANKAMCIHATFLERKEKNQLDLFVQAAERAEAQAQRDPKDPNAWYLYAYAMGRYSQGISVAKALAQGLGSKVKEALERAIKLQPRHADAHIALGTFHAEVIDKVGALIGGMTYGAKKETGLKLFREGLRLNPQSAIALVEYANGLVMLEGESALPEATRLYEQASRIEPLDATERLNVELAQAELQD